MLKLIILFALLATITAKPAGVGLLPAQVNLLSEKTIESHGNHIIHAAAPLIQSGPTIVPIAQTSSVAVRLSSTPENLPLKSEVKDGTLTDVPLSIDKVPEKKSQQIQPPLPLTYAAPASFYHTAPIAVTKFTSPSILETHHLAYAAPFYYSLPHALIGERSITSHGHSVVHWG